MFYLYFQMLHIAFGGGCCCCLVCLQCVLFCPFIVRYLARDLVPGVSLRTGRKSNMRKRAYVLQVVLQAVDGKANSPEK